MGAGRRLLCFSIFIIITWKKKKGCCFIKFRDDAIFPLFFPSISFLPLFHNSIVLAFIPGLSYIAELSEEKKKEKQQQQKEKDLLLRTEEGEDFL